MPNIEKNISSHNKKILKPTENIQHDGKPKQTKLCNCRNKSSCPLDNNCLQKCVIYQAAVKHNNNIDTYIGVTENEFKTQYNAHISSFKLENKRTATTLSEHIWNLKTHKKDYNITWSVISKTTPYNPNKKTCNLCIEESYQTLKKKPSLNRNIDLLKSQHRKNIY